MKRWMLLCLIGGLAFAAVAAEPAQKAQVTRTEDVVYGRKFGTALTMDVFRPQKANGIGIILVVSGGWVSNHDNLVDGSLWRQWSDPLVEKGYTVFAACHGCQPKFAISEIVPDLQRAVRFVRHNAARYGVDPDRLGITGGSAGGHLSLMIATTGSKGDPKAKDPIDRESSAVQCVACFFPPTDFLNYGKPGGDAFGDGPLKGFRASLGSAADTDTLEKRQKLGKPGSPIYLASAATPPILMIHGDADKIVPFQQAESFAQRCEELKVPVKLVRREGKDHGWPHMETEIPLFADWFDQHLNQKK